MSNFSLSITNWYRLNHRNLPWRNTDNPYFIWLSEIILQQTKVDQGKSYYQKFINNYPTVSDLAKASEQQVLNDWQGLGYYSRARNLHASSKYIMDVHNGVFPDSYEEIIKLKGVGSYTAAAISSIAFNEKKAVVDGNVYRVLSRVFDISTPIDSTEGKKEFQLLADSLIEEHNPSEHNQALMEIGALICKPTNPLCSECPLAEQCVSLRKNTISERPIKKKKTKVRDRYFHFYIFDANGKTIIEKRGDKDIWRNMFQFPLFEESTHNVLEHHVVSKKSNVVKHILSHQKIFATFYHIENIPNELEENWQIINWNELTEYPIPRLIDKYLEEL